MTVLVAYFSRAGQNYGDGELVTLEKGYTLALAEHIRAALNATSIENVFYEIRRVEPYSEDYHECVEEGRVEFEADARPALFAPPLDLWEFDTIALGYPNWFGTMPQVVKTFLEMFDFDGKLIMPFCTHGGGGLGRSVEEIRALCPDAEVTRGLAVEGARVDESRDVALAWVRSIL